MSLQSKGTIPFLNKIVENQGLKGTILLWGLFGVAIVSAVVILPGKQTVTPIYWQASLHWIAGEDLYTGSQFGRIFVYLPQAAILQIPLALLPFEIAEPLWRIFNILLYGVSSYLFASLCPFLSIRKSFLLLSLFSIPLALSSALNGQINLTLAALFGLLTYLLSHQHYRLCVVICLIGLAFKPYMIAPLLLIGGIFPKRCLPTAFVGLLILFLFPFLLQDISYVLDQYEGFIQSSFAISQRPQHKDYASFFGMLHFFGMAINASLQIGASLILALSTFFYCLWHSRHHPQEENAIVLTSLASIFILLFSPITENNTYVMAGLLISYFFSATLLLPSGQRVLSATLIFFCYTAMLGSYQWGKLLTPGNVRWPAPLGLTILTGYLLLREHQSYKSGRVGLDPPK